MERLLKGQGLVEVDLAGIMDLDVRRAERPVEPHGIGAPAIPALGPDAHRRVPQTGQAEDLRQRRAGPLAAAAQVGRPGRRQGLVDGQVAAGAQCVPILEFIPHAANSRLLVQAFAKVLEEIGVVAGALGDRAHRLRRQSSDIRQGQGQRLLDLTQKLELPIVGMHRFRHLKLGHHEERVDRGDQALLLEYGGLGVDHPSFRVRARKIAQALSPGPAENPFTFQVVVFHAMPSHFDGCGPSGRIRYPKAGAWIVLRHQGSSRRVRTLGPALQRQIHPTHEERNRRPNARNSPTDFPHVSPRHHTRVRVGKHR